MEWEWELAGLDVQFAVHFAAEGEAPVDVVTSIKVVAGAPVQGSFKADRSGQVSLVWDNSSSYVRSKSVYFKAVAHEP